jgi:small redox-active disulfide protein 2
MVIKVLGSGCPTCKTLHEIVVEAVGDEDIEVQYVTDIAALIEAGIMTSPALMIDEEVVSAGRLPTKDEIKGFIEERRKESE